MNGEKKFWEEGLRFQCQGSGNCCVSRGGYGYVYMTIEDRRRMAKVLNLSTAAFTRKHCDQLGGIWKLKQSKTDECTFLKDKRCTVYQGRPTQCRTWPFWPEALKARTWTAESASFCPGVGKGKMWSKKEIETVLAEQVRSEDQYGS